MSASLRFPKSARSAPADRQQFSPRGADAGARLKLTEAMIRSVARSYGRTDSLALICLRATCRELLMRAKRRINFRHLDNAAACDAYRAMQLDDFTQVNAMQAWANWRTIPRNLNGRLAERPISAIDLCAGVGDSTAVLAYYCSPGSQILGLEYIASFVEFARSREFVDRRGMSADVTFNAQSVLDPFRQADGRLVAAESVDLINACGAVGCHFDRRAMETLADECVRVLRPEGMALIDARRGATDVTDVTDVFRRRGFRVVGQARSCVFDRGRQLCLQR